MHGSGRCGDCGTVPVLACCRQALEENHESPVGGHLALSAFFSDAQGDRGWVAVVDCHAERPQDPIKVLFPKSEVVLELDFLEVTGVLSRQGGVVCQTRNVCEECCRDHTHEEQEGQVFSLVGSQSAQVVEQSDHFSHILHGHE
jgi:hypothetical protein